LAILLNESTWEKVKMPKSLCSKTLVKIIMAWSLTTKWNWNWKPNLSIDDNEVIQSYQIFFLSKTRLMSFSSEDRSEHLKTLEALINYSRKTDDLQTYAKVARKLLEATKR